MNINSLFSADKREVKLFLLGFLTLLLELVLIRYLAGSIWNLGFFPNIVLIAVFVGMGIGFIFHDFVTENMSNWLYMAAPCGLLLLILFVHTAHPVVPGLSGWSSIVGGELFFGTAQTGNPVVSYVLFPFWFILIVGIFILISQRTAKIFAVFPPLKAYTLDIAGSCCGILCFIVLSWLKVPAYGWFLLLIPLFVAAFDSTTSRNRLLIYIPLIASVFIVCFQDTYFFARTGDFKEHQAIWSPYQRIDFVRHPNGSGEISVNGISHQVLLRPEQIENSFYKLPYLTRRKTGKPVYGRALIIGAGSGNDAAAALKYGVGQVDAVEIDPVIAEIGRKYHPAEPYNNNAVNLIIDDGRSFMTLSGRKYDIIIFALTDSLVKTSPVAQLRLENYLFTKQAVLRALSLLNKDGDIYFYNYYREPWLISKMYSMIAEASGTPPMIVAGNKDFVIFKTQTAETGSVIKNMPRAPVDIPTDDWPFLYLQKKGIPGLYIKAMAGLAAVVILLMALLYTATRKRKDREKGFGALAVKIAFILMGIAFLLLETKSVIQFSLLFGTTWLNSSLVFLSVLLLVLAANWTTQVIKWKAFLPWVYAMLILSCLIPLVYPLSNLLYYENRVLRFALASLLLFSPIYFANLMFSILFRVQKTAEHYFGWNLFGATLGGVMEYCSMALGYNILTVIVAICYTGVILCLFAAKYPVFSKPAVIPVSR